MNTSVNLSSRDHEGVVNDQNTQPLPDGRGSVNLSSRDREGAVTGQNTQPLPDGRGSIPLSHEETHTWELRLYIAGQSPKSVTAFANLQKLCEEHLPGRYQIEVIDLMQQPQLAAGDQIVAIPTLIRTLPEPLRRIVGDLSNTERTLVGLQLRPANQNQS